MHSINFFVKRNVIDYSSIHVEDYTFRIFYIYWLLFVLRDTTFYAIRRKVTWFFETFLLCREFVSATGFRFSDGEHSFI